jgi:hypothetical protein
VRPDQRIVFNRAWAGDRERIQGLHGLIGELARMAG